MSADKAFFDTNMLLYMHSSGSRAKQAKAQRLFEECTSDGRLLLSTQVVQEFYVAGTRKLGLVPEIVREAATALLQLPLVSIGPEHIVRAMEGEERYRISFWDALILAAAESGGARVLYTEDLSHRQQYGAITVQNPFV